MRVVQVLGPSTGGIGTYVRALAAYCVGAGDEVLVIGPRATLGHFDFAATGAGVHALDVGAPAALGALRRALRRAGADVVHAHGIKAGAAVNAASIGMPRARRPRRVVTLHNAMPAHGMRARITVCVEAMAVRPADVVLGASADLVDRAKALGAKESAFVPVPAPALPAAAHPRAYMRAELGVGHGELLLLSVGRLAAQKSVPVLLDAVDELAGTRGDGARPVRLVIAGDGPQREEIAARIAARRLPVTLLGHRSDVADLLAAADVFVIASRWEARALVVQEALRAGVPVVATSVGGLPDLVGDAALLVPWDDAPALAGAVRRVDADPRVRERLAQAGPRRAALWPGTDEALCLARGWYF
jgi:glycosyltransferase involved in cell wall biosynthesis